VEEVLHLLPGGLVVELAAVMLELVGDQWRWLLSPYWNVDRWLTIAVGWSEWSEARSLFW